MITMVLLNLHFPLFKMNILFSLFIVIKVIEIMFNIIHNLPEQSQTHKSTHTYTIDKKTQQHQRAYERISSLNFKRLKIYKKILDRIIENFNIFTIHTEYLLCSICIVTFPCCFVYLEEGQSKNIPLENDFGSYLESRFVHLL